MGNHPRRLRIGRNRLRVGRVAGRWGAAWITIISTLNIQHLESLNDTVEALTGIRVRETIPDSVVDNADELIKVLSRIANQERQSEITTEISEIVGGAEALRQASGE